MLSERLLCAGSGFSTSPLLNPVAECISTEVYSYYVYVDNYLVGKLPSVPGPLFTVVCVQHFSGSDTHVSY